MDHGYCWKLYLRLKCLRTLYLRVILFAKNLAQYTILLVETHIVQIYLHHILVMKAINDEECNLC